MPTTHQRKPVKFGNAKTAQKAATGKPMPKPKLAAAPQTPGMQQNTPPPIAGVNPVTAGIPAPSPMPAPASASGGYGGSGGSGSQNFAQGGVPAPGADAPFSTPKPANEANAVGSWGRATGYGSGPSPFGGGSSSGTVDMAAADASGQGTSASAPAATPSASTTQAGAQSSAIPTPGGYGNTQFYAAGGDVGSQDQDQSGGFDTAMSKVLDTLQYVRQKNGLGNQGNQSQQQPQQGVPDTSQDNNTKNYAEGGDVEDDSEDSTPLEAGDDAAGGTDDNTAAPAIPTPTAAAAIPAPQGAAASQPSGAIPLPGGNEGTPSALSEFQQGTGQMGNAIGDVASSMNAAASGPPGAGLEAGQMLSGVNPKAMGYMMGQGGTSQNTLKQVEAKIDPQGQMDGSQRTVAVIASAPNQEVAGQYMQAFRQRYNMQKAGAATALDKGNLVVSAQNATQAYENVPDGNHITFQPLPNNQGVGVNVTEIGGASKTFNLTVPQYKQFLHGTDGQYDNLMENDAASVIARAAQAGGVQQTPTGTAATNATATAQPTGASTGAATPGQQPQGGAQGSPFNKAPITMGAKPAAPAAEPLGGYTPQQIAEARARFPLVSQHGKMMDWLNAQKQQEETNKINEMKARNPLGIQQLKGQNYNQRTEAKSADVAAQNQSRERIASQGNAAKVGNAMAQQQIALMRSYIAAGQLDPSTDQGIQAIRKASAISGLDPQSFWRQVTQVGGSGGQNPAGNAPAAGSRTVNGVTYTKAADGKWYKQGSQPAQQ